MGNMSWAQVTFLGAGTASAGKWQQKDAGRMKRKVLALSMDYFEEAASTLSFNVIVRARPSRFPPQIGFVWRVCMGARWARNGRKRRTLNGPGVHDHDISRVGLVG